jgi:hypothetical protein
LVKEHCDEVESNHGMRVVAAYADRRATHLRFD